jgi:hypothetical protein
MLHLSRLLPLVLGTPAVPVLLRRLLIVLCSLRFSGLLLLLGRLVLVLLRRLLITLWLLLRCWLLLLVTPLVLVLLPPLRLIFLFLLALLFPLLVLLCLGKSRGSEKCEQ